MFSDRDLFEIASGQPLELYMTPKQIKEFYSLNEKEICDYWLKVKSVKEQFDAWIRSLSAEGAMIKIAKFAILEWAADIVNNQYLGYSEDEAMDVASAAGRANRALRASIGTGWREEMRRDYGLD